MRKSNRLIAGVLVLSLAALVIAVVGCKQSKVDKPTRPRIALVMKSLANEFFKTMEEGAIAHQKEHGAEYDLITVGIKTEEDVARQIELVETMMGLAEAIVIAPADSKALVPVCKKAMDRGIVVVNIDNKFDRDVLEDKNAKIPFVGPDNRKGAALAGECLAGKLQKGDKVAIIEGMPNAYNGIQRKLGFEDAVKKAGLNIISSQSGNWEMEKANQVAAAVITERPDLKAFLCANDSMALGAVFALKAAGKSEAVLVTGFDNISAVQKLLKEGRILCTVDQHADKLAVYGIEYALEMLAKKGMPVDRETPVDLITAETLK